MKNATKKPALYTFTADVETSELEGDSINVKIDFSDKTSLSIDVGALTPEIRNQLIVHGLKQKIVDAAAIGRDSETGASATPEEKIEAMRAVGERLLAGIWRVTSEGGGNNGGLLFRALSILYPNKDIKGWLDGLTDKQKSALRDVPKIKAEIDKIRAKTAKASSVDVNALLESLGEAPF